MTETAFGACTEISERNGWTHFHIDTGGKWPLKLGTKKPDIIEAARAVGHQPAVWSYNETESENVNPNSGKPYINRYLEGVDLDGDGGDVRAQAQESLNPAVKTSGDYHLIADRRPLVGGDKDRAITRMACLKAAAETLTADGRTHDDAALEVMKIAARYEQWVMRDLEDIPF